MWMVETQLPAFLPPANAPVLAFMVPSLVETPFRNPGFRRTGPGGKGRTVAKKERFVVTRSFRITDEAFQIGLEEIFAEDGRTEFSHQRRDEGLDDSQVGIYRNEPALLLQKRRLKS